MAKILEWKKFVNRRERKPKYKCRNTTSVKVLFTGSIPENPDTQKLRHIAWGFCPGLKPDRLL